MVPIKVISEEKKNGKYYLCAVLPDGKGVR